MRLIADPITKYAKGYLEGFLELLIIVSASIPLSYTITKAGLELGYLHPRSCQHPLVRLAAFKWNVVTS